MTVEQCIEALKHFPMDAEVGGSDDGTIYVGQGGVIDTSLNRWSDSHIEQIEDKIMPGGWRRPRYRIVVDRSGEL